MEGQCVSCICILVSRWQSKYDLASDAKNDINFTADSSHSPMLESRYKHLTIVRAGRWMIEMGKLTE
jgi:hypothetical protein